MGFYQLNIGKFILLFIYFLVFCFLINKGLENNTITNSNLIIFILNSIYIVLMIVHSNFLLPRQFTPLSELNVTQKTWRIIVSIMAIFWGGLITLGTLSNIVLGKATIGQLITGSIFSFVAYAGVKMLTAKSLDDND